MQVDAAEVWRRALEAAIDRIDQNERQADTEAGQYHLGRRTAYGAAASILRAERNRAKRQLGEQP